MGLLNVIVLILEILFYSLFMKYSRKEGNIIRYLILFTLFSFISVFLSKQFFINYILIFLFILYGLKYIVKLKVSLYDLLVIIIMFAFKIIIEIPLYYIMTIVINGVLATMIFQSLKILIVFLLRNKLSKMYIKLKNKWDNNNFYIRYIFTILLYVYIIFSCIFLILRYS